MCLFLELAVEDATSKSECRSVLKLEYSTLTLNNCIFTPLALLNYFHTVYYIICKVLQCAAAAPQTATLHFSFTPLFNYFNIVNYIICKSIRVRICRPSDRKLAFCTGIYLLLYIYWCGITVQICCPADRTMGRPRTEIRTRDDKST